MWVLPPASHTRADLESVARHPDYPESERPYLIRFLDFWFSDTPYLDTRTSGSTGEPGRVLLSREAMLASARMSLQYFGIRSDTDGLASVLSLRHIGGLMVLLRALYGKLHLAILPPTATPSGPDLPGGDRAWLVSMVPLQLENALKNPEFIRHTRDWKGILLGGASPGPALRASIAQLNCPVFESYGMTETASHIAIARLHPPPATAGFELLPGVEAGSGEDGCLWVEGSVTPKGRLHTTDRVEWLTPGSFRVTGRASRTINSGGLKIQPEQVCQRIRELAGEPEMDIECLGLPHPRLGEEVVLVQRGGSLHDWDMLLEKVTRPELRREFPGKVYQLAAWPLTPSFKTDFPALKKELSGLQPVWTRISSL